MSGFEQIMQELDAPDYPSTCNACGSEGTNQSLLNHECLPIQTASDLLASISDDLALKLIDHLQTWAKAKYGEREYVYYTVNHFWRESRTASGRSRRDGSYAVSCRPWNEEPCISKEEYEAHVAEGMREYKRAFMGERKGGSYLTYERHQTKLGWQDELIKLVQQERRGD